MVEFIHIIYINTLNNLTGSDFSNCNINIIHLNIKAIESLSYPKEYRQPFSERYMGSYCELRTFSGITYCLSTDEAEKIRKKLTIKH